MDLTLAVVKLLNNVTIFIIFIQAVFRECPFQVLNLTVPPFLHFIESRFGFQVAVQVTAGFWEERCPRLPNQLMQLGNQDTQVLGQQLQTDKVEARLPHPPVRVEDLLQSRCDAIRQLWIESVRRISKTLTNWFYYDRCTQNKQKFVLLISVWLIKQNQISLRLKIYDCNTET